MSSGRGASLGRVCTLAALFAILPTQAYANGAFPSAGQILVDPDEPSKAWVRTSFGFAKTSDGGETFHLICEDAIGYSSGYHPHAALSSSGALYMGLADGLSIGRGDTCAFERAPDLEDLFIVDVSTSPDGRAIALAKPPNGARLRVYYSDDDLETWAPLGNELPDKLIPLTLDAAPSDPNVIYVSAGTEGTNGRGVLVSSTDGGATWTTWFVPGTDATEVQPFIAAVDPNVPSRVYVRVNGTPGRLTVTEDYGENFEDKLTTTGFLYAFKLAPDGASAIYGGNLDGINRLDTTTYTTEPLARITARCATLAGTTVYACGDESADGFSAGISLDAGASFSPFLRNRCFEGILPCESGTPVHDTCEPQWPSIKDLIGAEGDCDAAGGGGQGAGASGAGGSGNGGNGATGGAGEGGRGQGANGSSNGGSSASGGGGAGDSGDGCSCTATPEENQAFSSLSTLMTLLSLGTIARVTTRKKNARHAPSETSGRDHRRGCGPRPRPRAASLAPRRAPRPR